MNRPILTLNGLRPRPAQPARPEPPAKAKTSDTTELYAAMRANLVALYPAHFSLAGRAAPLPIGTGDVVLALLTADGFTHADVQGFMRRWTRSTRYLEAIAADGAVRISLDGSTSEPVADDHRTGAVALLLHRKRRASATAPAPRGGSRKPVIRAPIAAPTPNFSDKT